MKIVVLVGAPGVGKGTQGSMLAQRLGGCLVSTGDLLRREIKAGSELGNRVRELLARGDLVSDEELFSSFGRYLKEDLPKDSPFLIVDGVPRTFEQVSKLDRVLDLFSLKVELVIQFLADNEALKSRLSSRFVCLRCSNIVSFETEDLARSELCGRCGEKGLFSRRPDDEPATVLRRLDLFSSLSGKICAEYASRGILSSVDGLRDVEQVFKSVQIEIIKLLQS